MKCRHMLRDPEVGTMIGHYPDLMELRSTWWDSVVRSNYDRLVSSQRVGLSQFVTRISRGKES